MNAHRNPQREAGQAAAAPAATEAGTPATTSAGAGAPAPADVTNEARRCEIGQATPCGRPASYMIAVTTVRDTGWSEDARLGGIVFVCADHATLAPCKWDEGEFTR